MNRTLALIFAGLMMITSQAKAHDYRQRPGPYNHSGWVAPIVIGGVVGYALSHHREPQTVIIQQPSPYPPVPQGYHYENILDASCNCYRVVLIPNQ